jgi:large subunit ribosomal protein L25
MAQISFQATTRQGRGKGPARRLRAQGLIPGIIYGGERPPQAIALETHALDLHLHHGLGSSTLINLQIEGEDTPQLAILREIQRDPVSNRLRHADFLRVRLDQMVEFDIPVHGVGTSPAVKTGGILEHATRTVTVRCLPMAVPERIEVDLTGLTFGHPVHLSDITLPKDVEAVSDPQTVLYAVVMPRAIVAAGAAAEGEEAEAEAEAEAAAEEPTEPEVIGKGKREEGQE